MNKLLSFFTRTNLEKYEKIITMGIYYILPAIVLITLLLAGTKTDNIGFARQRRRGENGRNILAIVLFIKPISFLGRKYLNAQLITMSDFLLAIKNLPATIKQNHLKMNRETAKSHLLPFIINSIYSISVYLMRFRRQLGILAFWLLLTHGLLRQIFWIRQNLPLFFNVTEWTPLTGIIALFALIIGAVTSNTYAVKLLKSKRKPVQMAAYFAFFFGALHTGNLPIFIIYLAAKYFEWRDTGVLTNRKQFFRNIANKIPFTHLQK